MKKILVANRGEIAVRIIRTCRDMGLASVAVYSACDRNALHVRLADEAVAIGPDAASESYLRVDRLIDAARTTGADAVHPGYGFLAENAGFADACRAQGLTFIGPSPEAMATMGNKTSARRIAIGAGVPVVPGTETPLDARAPDREIAAAAAAVGYPLLVKAVAGGGGKGMRVVRGADDLHGAVAIARSEARSAFGDDGVYLERLLEKPRHIEVQLLGDAHGTVVPFAERECSLQRRHQKLIEESPSPSVSEALRADLMAAATVIGRAAGYTSAGTVEFLVDASGKYYFLEMNTRLQVEHPVTEAVTGIDLVRAQIEITQGATLADLADLKVGSTKVGSTKVGSTKVGSTTHGARVASAGVEPPFRPATGHAIECRIYAEDPEEGFRPSPGRITHLRAPSGPGIRDDSGVYAGWVVPASYDPLISKVIAWAPDRAGAMARMVRALTEYDVRGIKTTVGFCRWLLDTPAFKTGEFDTTTIDRLIDEWGSGVGDSDPSLEELVAAVAALFAYRSAGQPRAERSGQPGADSLWARQARLDGLRP